MLSETLQRGLRSYSIGDKIRELRLRKKMGLVELGRHTGLSAALLSKIERGRLFPTLPTLLRVALVFSVSLEYFFADDRSRHTFAVVRKKERKRFPIRPGSKDAGVFFECLDFNAIERKINAYIGIFPARSSGKPFAHDHEGIEFIYVLSGKLVLTLRDEETVLDAGDSIYFDSTVTHSYHRGGSRPCTAVVVTAP
jgi:transcriptional regulator with XRE-family HTH domain